MGIEDEILNLPILEKRIGRNSPLFDLLVNNKSLVFRARNILKSLKSNNYIHDAIVKECINENSVKSFEDKLAKYHVASVFKEAGCTINKIELKNKKCLKKTDIECEYNNTIILIEVKHMNITPDEQDIEKEAFNKGELSYDIPYKKAHCIPLPCNDPLIESVTDHSKEISKFKEYLKSAEKQIAASKKNYSFETYGIVAFVVSSILFDEEELKIAFWHYLNETNNLNIVSATMFIKYPFLQKIYINRKQNTSKNIVSLLKIIA
ncbi:MAG: hypothetical protein AMJ90_08965 [candidate division Zixibacteria bacterium SM23_73_2]|nr:MAG: hypothetical protein AMJ90_08965 [candidate division Zixibacteria bacterium SM23_73_2]